MYTGMRHARPTARVGCVGVLATWIGLALVGPTALAGPVAALDFRFNDLSGTTVPNHGHLGALGKGTLSTGTTVVTGPTPLIRGGYENAALVIDSSTDLMSTVDIDSLDTLGSFTLSMFIKPTGNLADWRDIAGDNSPSSSLYSGWYMQGRFMNAATSPRKRAFFLVGPGTGTASVQFQSADDFIVPNTWQQLALVVTGLQDPGTHTIKVDFYRNGEFFSTQSTSVNYTMGNSVPGFKLGDALWDASLYAQYAGVALFDTALSAQEIRDQYTYMTTPEPATLASLLAGLGCLALGGVVRRRFWQHL